MSDLSDRRPRRWSAAPREGEQVTPLELFFDLVFVLAITQCTTLMASQPTIAGLLKGVLVLGLLWWSWVGYAWLTSVVDPEEGAVRLAMFAAMGAFLVVALCVPRAYGSLGPIFALAYGAVRALHIVLYLLASRGDRALRRSILTGLMGSTVIGVTLLVAGSFLAAAPRAAVWTAALLLDAAGPMIFGSEGWKLAPAHFAERHGLIVLIALGEAIVSIGVGAGADVTAGVITAALLGTALAAAMWWAYFDVVALVAARRLASAAEGRERNEIARDSYSYLHLPMVTGVVLVAFGLKTTLAHTGHHLRTAPALALLGGCSLYLLAHVAFRLRNVGTLSRQRLVLALLLLALFPAAATLPAVGALALVSVLFSALIAYEAVRFAEMRARVRHQPGEGPIVGSGLGELDPVTQDAPGG